MYRTIMGYVESLLNGRSIQQGVFNGSKLSQPCFVVVSNDESIRDVYIWRVKSYKHILCVYDR